MRSLYLHIVFFFVMFLGLPLNNYGQGEYTPSKKSFKKTKSYWSVLPIFSPEFRVSKKVKINSGSNSNTFFDPKFRYGFRVLKHYPNYWFTYGFELGIMNENLSVLDKYTPSFNVQEFYFMPFLHFKTGGISKKYHFFGDLGFSYSRAFHRSVEFFDNSKISDSKLENLNNQKFRIMVGGGVSIDLKSKNLLSKHLTLGLQYFHYLNSDYFKNGVANTPQLSYYSNHSFNSNSFGLLFGYNTSLSKPKFERVSSEYGNKTNPFNYYTPPFYFEEPTKRSFGGFNFGVLHSRTSDTMDLIDGANVSKIKLRQRYNYQFGYRFHFLGNQATNSFIKANLFGGINYYQRSWVNDISENDVIDFNTLALEGGGRVQLFSGIYLNSSVLFNYNISQKVLSGDFNLEKLKRFNLAYSFGLSYRNYIGFYLQYNDLKYIKLTDPQLQNQLKNRFDYKVVVGF